MLGAIIGDIVGSRFEFNNHRSKDFEFFHKDCSFTDDTICTVAVADAITIQRRFDFMFIKWFELYPNPMGGYGSSFHRWLLQGGGDPYNSYGNGAAMRVSPCGWIGDLLAVFDYAEKSASVTHSHPEGIKGAQCIADLIWRLRHGQEKAYIELHCDIGYGYDINLNLDQLRKTNTFDETCQVTVPQAIACFLQSTDFEDCIRNAVSIGGDSDTIAAIAGSLAEAHYGVPEWMEAKAMEYLPNDMIEVYNRFKTLIK